MCRLRRYQQDGSPIRYRHFPPTQETAPLVIVIHGSGWHGEAYLDLASVLSNDGEFEVIVPDLRGHGVDPYVEGRRLYWSVRR